MKQLSIYEILEKLNSVNSEATRSAVEQVKNLNHIEESEQLDESSYSAKDARAGKDIGKPGKAFSKIAKDAGERYGSKERGEKVAGAVLKKLRAHEGVEETDMEEGNAFSGAIAKAKADGIQKGETIKFAGKTYPVKEEELDEMEYHDRDRFDKNADTGDTYKRGNMTITKTKSGIQVKHAPKDDADSNSDDDYDEFGNLKAGAKKKADGEKKGRGRPKGTGKKIGARGPQFKKKVKESDDDAEYGQEGDMAKDDLHSLQDAAAELSSILNDNDDLPEWVQSKITKALDYINSSNQYMHNEKRDMDDVEEPVAEKAVSKAQQKFMGMVHAAQKGEKPASKEVAKVAKSMKKSDATDFAATKHKGLPEKKEKEVEENTVAGSVATAPAGGKAKGIFGKGVYEGKKVDESFEKRFNEMLSESMSVNVSADTNGQKNVTVTANDEDAEHLSQLLKMAGLFGSGGYESACSSCGCQDCECDSEAVEEDYSNSPAEEVRDTEYMTNTIAGGLNKKKVTGMTTIPVVPTQKVTNEEVDRAKNLWNLYQDYKAS
jgi:hypothetical protein